VVVAASGQERLLGTPPDPEAWSRVGEDEFVRSSAEPAGVGVRFVDEASIVVVPTQAELQDRIDQTVGIGIIDLTPVAYVRFVVHEAFHVRQLQVMDGELPMFGLLGDEADLLPVLGATEVADGLASESRLLRDALVASAESDALASAEEFLQARSSRRAALAPDAVALERSLEWSEGLARYADVRLLQAAADDYEASTEFSVIASYPSADSHLATQLEWLEDLTAVPGSVRDRYYEVGAAQALLLDRVMPGWQARAMPGGESLEDLLANAVEGAAEGVPASLRAMDRRSVTIDGRSLTVAIADRQELWATGLAGLDDLGPLGGALFVFPEPVEASFTNRGTAMELDLAYFDADGRWLSTDTLPACPSGECAVFRSPGSFRFALETPRGGLEGVGTGSVLEIPEP
jgi:uncharacterized membrane protein (UPF0127 family)